MKRRRFLSVLGTAGCALSGCAISLEDGIWNPCLEGGLPGALAGHDLVRAAWEGVDPAQFWDCHVHVGGVGDGESGLWISPQMQSLVRPWRYLQRSFYLNAACAEKEGMVDELFVRRLALYLGEFPPGAKAMLLAFDFHYDDTGKRREDLSAFHVPDFYAAELVRRFPARFEWICSVHPYRPDAIAALERAVAQGARAVKWVPSVMGMDPASAKCDRFYEALVRLGVPLLSHGGAEHALRSGADPELNNPLRLRRPLDHGVRVVLAHCATIGSHLDIDRGPNGPEIEAFALFARLMDESRYEGALFGDISAVAQANRMGAPLATLLARDAWHSRLVNGSDYPLPGVIPQYSMRRLVDEGYLRISEAAVLVEVRRYNALLFDFVLKRSLCANGSRFAPVVFESRRAFDASTQRPRPPERRKASVAARLH